MANKSIKGLYEDLPATIKLVLIIVGIIVVFVIVRRVFKYFEKRFEIADAQTEINALQQAGQQPSYPQSQYTDLANQLYNSVEGMGTWDDELDEVFNQLNNDIDFLLLKSSFGLRDGYTMQEWLNGDLSDGRKEDINSVLSIKGITYRI